MSMANRRRLGRGLAALIGDDVAPATAPVQDTAGLKTIPIAFISPSPHNPRRVFTEEEIDSLAVSLRNKGVLQPLIVRPGSNGTYQIVAGERRWRAAQKAGLHDVPVLVRDLDDRETLEIAIIENVQRSDLNPLEEAQAYKQLIDNHGYTQQQLADSIGKSRSHVANTIRLTTLPESVLQQIQTGLLSAGHARALVATDNPQELAQKIIQLGLSVRQAEEMARQKSETQRIKVKPIQDADTRALARDLSNSLGLNVGITHNKGRGQVTISYKSLEQLDMIVALLSKTQK